MAKERVTLRASARATSGKGPARQLRRSGRLPAVVYGRRDDAESLSVDTNEFSKLLSRIRAATTVIDLEVDGEEPRPVLIRDIQRHPYRPQLLHIDFFEIRADVKLRVRVPVRLVGTAAGTTMGGNLQHVLHELEVESLPHEIPVVFDVDVSALDIGDSINVADVASPDGVEVLDDPTLSVCMVVAPMAEETAEEGEEDAPEEAPEEGAAPEAEG